MTQGTFELMLFSFLRITRRAVLHPRLVYRNGGERIVNTQTQNMATVVQRPSILRGKKFENLHEGLSIFLVCCPHNRTGFFSRNSSSFREMDIGHFSCSCADYAFVLNLTSYNATTTLPVYARLAPLAAIIIRAFSPQRSLFTG